MYVSTLPNKGDLVTLSWFQATKPAALAGMQIKFAGIPVTIVGHVAHVRGDDPQNPSYVGIWIKVDDALKMDPSQDWQVCQRHKCKGALEIGPFDLKHLVPHDKAS